jgi:hypothetical protein
MRESLDRKESRGGFIIGLARFFEQNKSYIVVSHMEV